MDWSLFYWFYGGLKDWDSIKSNNPGTGIDVKVKCIEWKIFCRLMIQDYHWWQKIDPKKSQIQIIQSLMIKKWDIYSNLVLVRISSMCAFASASVIFLVTFSTCMVSYLIWRYGASMMNLKIHGYRVAVLSVPHLVDLLL